MLYAVFDRGSGRTHMITDVAQALLEAARLPGSAADLCARVRAAADIEAQAGTDIDDVLKARIQELAELDLLTLVS